MKKWPTRSRCRLDGGLDWPKERCIRRYGSKSPRACFPNYSGSGGSRCVRYNMMTPFDDASRQRDFRDASRGRAIPNKHNVCCCSSRSRTGTASIFPSFSTLLQSILFSNLSSSSAEYVGQYYAKLHLSISLKQNPKFSHGVRHICMINLLNTESTDVARIKRLEVCQKWNRPMVQPF